MATCYKCGAEDLPQDVVGLNKKLINRGIERYLCLGCLSREFGESEKALLALADRLREQGCSLFPPKPAPSQKP